METASFRGLIEMILYILMFYYLFKFLAKIFLPILMKKAVEKAAEKMQNQYGWQDSQTQYTKQKDGEVIIDDSNVKSTRTTKKVGEYVDYEEIE